MLHPTSENGLPDQAGHSERPETPSRTGQRRERIPPSGGPGGGVRDREPDPLGQRPERTGPWNGCRGRRDRDHLDHGHPEDQPASGDSWWGSPGVGESRARRGTGPTSVGNLPSPGSPSGSRSHDRRTAPPLRHPFGHASASSSFPKPAGPVAFCPRASESALRLLGGERGLERPPLFLRICSPGTRRL